MLLDGPSTRRCRDDEFAFRFWLLHIADFSDKRLQVPHEMPQRVVCQAKLPWLRDRLELGIRFHAIELFEQLLETDQSSFQVDLHFLVGADHPFKLQIVTPGLAARPRCEAFRKIAGGIRELTTRSVDLLCGEFVQAHMQDAETHQVRDRFVFGIASDLIEELHNASQPCSQRRIGTFLAIRHQRESGYDPR